VQRNRTLCLVHLWTSLAVFAPMIVLGAWQMLVRSRWPAPLDDPDAYYASVTLHGTAMAYVMPTFFAMGMGYAIAETTLGRPMRGTAAAWLGYLACAAGTVMAVVPIVMLRASVLYTFYPPLTGSAWYYGGVLLVVLGSWIWVALMVWNTISWKAAFGQDQPVPLAMFAITATALLWWWSSLGVVAELVLTVIPNVLGWTQTIDPGLARTLFSVTLHGIVYFWLMPAYIAYYALLPQAAGGRLYSDTLGRLTFILFLVFSLPVGLHHLLMDPEHSAGWKFLQSVFTGMVVLPTLLTIFTITASLELAGRINGGKGLLGWIWALPWHRPMVLAAGLSLVMLGFGGFGGVINMSYAMNAMIHNTQWVTAHFHLIFGGAVVIMYMAVAYELWPRLTGRPLASERWARIQLWLWFIGMMVVTIPWHVTGLMGMPRRYAIFDYADPFIARMGWLVDCSVLGGVILIVSVVGLIANLGLTHSMKRSEISPLQWALAINPPHRLPPSLNGFGLWNMLVLVMLIAAYGYPIAQFALMPPHSAVGFGVAPRGG
jgi:cytochrome c oxidase subunit I